MDRFKVEKSMFLRYPQQTNDLPPDSRYQLAKEVAKMMKGGCSAVNKDNDKFLPSSDSSGLPSWQDLVRN